MTKLYHLHKIKNIRNILKIQKMLATVKHSAVNMVFVNWSVVKLPNLGFTNKYLIEYQNVKIVKSDLKLKNARKTNIKAM